MKFCLFSTSGALFAPKTLQDGKVSPKVENAHLCVSGSKNVPRCLRFKGFGASGEKRDFSISMHFCDFPLFGRKADSGAQKWKNHPRSAKSSLFRFVAKMAPKMTKKALATARFRANAGFLRVGAKKTQKCVLERKVRNYANFHIFRSKSWKMHFWGDNLKDP